MYRGLTLLVFVCSSGAALAEDASARLTFESCRACHGGDAAIPAIQGQPFETLLESMTGFAGADDRSTIMHKFMTGLSAAETEALARYISSEEREAR